MEHKIQLLDCTLRDGCYIVSGDFGPSVLKGIIKKLDNANVDIIECGWLKNNSYQYGSAFYHVPSDAIQYLPQKKRSGATFAVMIDWDRYDLNALPHNDGKSVDAIRIVFPRDKFMQAIPLGKLVQQKGYRLFFQAANTLSYSDEELLSMVSEINRIMPESLSIVDTFGAMFPEDLHRIFSVLDQNLLPDIKLGFHSHNNMQMSFALSMEFIKLAQRSKRCVVIDSSLYGMGRGAGNTPTELLVNYLNRKVCGNYDMNEIMDAIDLYLLHLRENYQWGYSIPYSIAGMYCTHVNNISYLIKNHKTLAKDMRIIIESIDPQKRQVYDYDNLEKVYVNYQNRIVDDNASLVKLEATFRNRKVLLLGPGKTQTTYQKEIEEYIKSHQLPVIGINTVPQNIPCDYYFFVNPARYLYAQETKSEQMADKTIILTSNIKKQADSNEMIINFNLLCKLGWQFFDNACVMCLRLMEKLHVSDVAFAGFDGFPEEESVHSFYADKVTQPVVSLEKRKQINADITGMLLDFIAVNNSKMNILFVTPSRFQSLVQKIES